MQRKSFLQADTRSSSWQPVLKQAAYRYFVREVPLFETGAKTDLVPAIGKSDRIMDFSVHNGLLVPARG